ncbi:MAG: O-antigen ligase family protein [Gammaproteobacteria bacterium]
MTLIVLTFVLMPTEHLFHYPIGLLGLLGIIYWGRLTLRLRNFAVPGADLQLIVVLFGCIFIPMLLSLGDAFNPRHATKTTFSYLHFLPAALYIAVICRDVGSRLVIFKSVAVLLAILVVDALVQFLLGVNLLGFPRDSAVLTGMFDANQRLGLVLALFLPLMLCVLNQYRSHAAWTWLLLIPYAAVVLLSLKRSAWVMLLVGGGVYLLLFVRLSTVSWRAKIFTPVAMVGIVVAVAYFVPSVGKTFRTTIGALNADYETLDIATSRRLTLWRTGKSIVAAHPVNGVGPRGYRYAYKDFAEPGDFWIRQNGKGQTHPHLMGLEVIVETGVIGLLGLIFFFYLLTKNMVTRAATEPLAAIWLVLAFVAWFPFNTHLAFYGSYWSTFAWLFVAIGAANPNRVTH